MAAHSKLNFVCDDLCAVELRKRPSLVAVKFAGKLGTFTFQRNEFGRATGMLAA
jgi:hypothetical protein